jgi:hypothetical protein
MNQIRGKLKNLKKKEKSKSRNKVIKNNINDLKELYKEMDNGTSESEMSKNLTTSHLEEKKSIPRKNRKYKTEIVESENRPSMKLKYYDRKKWQFTGIFMDLDDETLDGDDDRAGKERQKLIYLLAKREKDMQKKLKQLNEDVNYVMRSRLNVEGRRRRTNEGVMPVKKKTRPDAILEKEEENLKKKLENYKKETETLKQKIIKRKEEMLLPDSNKEMLLKKKLGLEEELKEIKHRVKMAETGVLSPKDELGKHHGNYNNDYMFKYKSRASENEDEGWSGHLSKEYKGEMNMDRRLEKKNKIVQKETMGIRVRLKKEIDFFIEKQKKIGSKGGGSKLYLHGINIFIMHFINEGFKISFGKIGFIIGDSAK